MFFLFVYTSNCQKTERFRPYIPSNITTRSDPMKIEPKDILITNEDLLFDQTARDSYDPESYYF
jgi:hypothetical protein